MNIFDFEVEDAQGNPVSLSQYRGKVLLIVNTASKCGHTPQYAGLEALYRAQKDHGLVILGFPCNQFMGQEPGSNAEIQEFCRMNYGVTFPVLAKIDVNGKNTHPLYKALKAAKKTALGSAIQWNFTKFLIGRDGTVVERFEPKVTPEALTPRVEEELQKP